ncbi:MAG: hypothetical protein IPO21_16750 [Bacteroidales bacterium]|nr:hypothetical protein [Bacteroidales bacterium]
MKRISLVVLVLIISLGLYAQSENKKRLRKIELQIQNALINDEFAKAEQLKPEKNLRVQLKEAYKKNDSVNIKQLEAAITKLESSKIQSNIVNVYDNQYYNISTVEKLDVEKIHKMTKSAFYADFFNNALIFEDIGDLGMGIGMGYMGYLAKFNRGAKFGINVRTSICTMSRRNGRIWNVFQVGPQFVFPIKDKRAIEMGILLGKDMFFNGLYYTNEPGKIDLYSFIPYVGIRNGRFGVSICFNFSNNMGSLREETPLSSKSLEVRVGAKF